jgi:hemerythrin
LGLGKSLHTGITNDLLRFCSLVRCLVDRSTKTVTVRGELFESFSSIKTIFDKLNANGINLRFLGNSLNRTPLISNEHSAATKTVIMGYLGFTTRSKKSSKKSLSCFFSAEVFTLSTKNIFAKGLALDTFNWDKSFETGVEDVDKQHQMLFSIINRFGELLIQQESTCADDIETVFTELVAYTEYHFREEENMMRMVGVDARFIAQHIPLHAEFLSEVQKMHQGVIKQVPNAAHPLLKYLVHWLAFHILGIDHSMSRQVAAIQAGQNAGDIFLLESDISKKVTEPLLLALDGLMHKVSDQNRELLELNKTLEKKVTERTSALSEANLRLEEMALTDVLTGLPNRRHAMARMAKEWKISIHAGAPLACMMIDADGFKQINDRYGHDSGDEVLRQLSRQLRYVVRTDDTVCRLGGDEFLVICPNTTEAGAMQIAEQIRQSVASLRVPAGSGEWVGSISVGVGLRSTTMHKPEDLIKAADDGVYMAKRNGRNCVACSTLRI